MARLNKPFKQKPDAPYYDRGWYLFEIAKCALNVRGEPYVNMRCIGSHDGRRINSYYPFNFFIEADSPKQRDLHTNLLSGLTRALGIDELVDTDQIEQGAKVAVHFSRAGYSPLPQFHNEERFNGLLAPNKRTVDQNTTPEVEEHPVPPLDAYEFDVFGEESNPFKSDPLDSFFDESEFDPKSDAA
ncbi:hypothetical protein [Shewanella gaetbuli]|uniref:DUF669 domain-containing protein n=1 Tax=Shewanella gaetbuli TaxID=220752 RepID=A0A9X1ZRV8_9GAMM|nr:hypothetical protein [Shewanella gaetbuli]MCL1142963.1 hypothetical protein [Shewanella gaetbuli]